MSKLSACSYNNYYKVCYCLPVAASKLTKVPATSQKNCFPIKLCYYPAPLFVPNEMYE